MWPILITFIIYVLFPGVDTTHIWLWAQLAVFLHVFVDIFNSYGTQALRPLTNKWIQLSVINTFDPIIFIILCAGLSFGYSVYIHSCSILPIISILIIYYIIRFKMQSIIKKQALSQIKAQHNPVKIFVAPTMKFMEWRVAIQTEEHDYVGRAFGRNVVFSDKVKRQKFSPDTLLWQIKSNKDIRTFLNFSSIYRDGKLVS